MNYLDLAGVYGNGNLDPFDLPVERLVFFVSESGQLCFQYLRESESNHGYYREFHEGMVRPTGIDAVMLITLNQCQWGWEDYYKKYVLRTSTETKPYQLQLTQEKQNGKWSFTFENTQFTWESHNTEQTLSRFADVISKSRSLMKRLVEAPKDFWKESG